MAKWVLTLSEMNQDGFNNLSLIHYNDKGFLYAEENAIVERTSFGFYILTGYLLPRSSFAKKYNNSQDLIEQLWNIHGSDWILYVKGYFNLVAFFDNEWWAVNDTLGLSKLYWSQSEGLISNSFDTLAIHKRQLTWNKSAFLSRKFFHRDIGEITIVSGIKKSRTGIQIDCKGNEIRCRYYFDFRTLKGQPIEKEITPEDFIEIWSKVFGEMHLLLPESRNIITITGGKDARTGLALLRYFKREVIGLTYGVSDSKDAVFAKKLAKAANLTHHIPNVPTTSQKWLKEVLACMDVDSYYISPHRAIRRHALSETIQSFHSPWYWGGYMGGEWLMGLYPDGLVFPSWVTSLSQGSALNKKVFDQVEDQSELEDIKVEIERIQQIVDSAKNNHEMQMIWMFEIGVLHHAQDLELASNEGANPYPFMMDIDFIEKLFRSKYSFFHQNHASKNLLQRWKLYEWNIRVQQRLMPKWGHVPFGKKGEYSPDVFMRGSLYWSLYKMVHYFFEKKKYPPSFSY
ncbi:MAG: hypothetical protein FJX95_07100, partial [Bacteroidetes bacterium]|nr:hypothetical protein [Bacteroidota bacterium]